MAGFDLLYFIHVLRPKSPQHFLRSGKNLMYTYLHNVQIIESWSREHRDIHPNCSVAKHLNLVPLCYPWTGHPSFWLCLCLWKLLVWIATSFDCILANQSICYCLLGKMPWLCKMKNELLLKGKNRPKENKFQSLVFWVHFPQQWLEPLVNFRNIFIWRRLL